MRPTDKIDKIALEEQKSHSHTCPNANRIIQLERRLKAAEEIVKQGGIITTLSDDRQEGIREALNIYPKNKTPYISKDVIMSIVLRYLDDFEPITPDMAGLNLIGIDPETKQSVIDFWKLHEDPKPLPDSDADSDADSDSDDTCDACTDLADWFRESELRKLLHTALEGNANTELEVLTETYQQETKKSFSPLPSTDNRSHHAREMARAMRQRGERRRRNQLYLALVGSLVGVVVVIIWLDQGNSSSGWKALLLTMLLFLGACTVFGAGKYCIKRNTLFDTTNDDTVDRISRSAEDADTIGTLDAEEENESASLLTTHAGYGTSGETRLEVISDNDDDEIIEGLDSNTDDEKYVSDPDTDAEGPNTYMRVTSDDERAHTPTIQSNVKIAFRR